MLFAEHAFLDRFAAARDAGFAAVEFQFPYDTPVDLLLAARDKAGVEVVLFNVAAGDIMTGGPGLAGLPGREGHFRAAVAEAKLYIEALRPRCVNVLAGWPPTSVERGACLTSLAANLRYAAEAIEPYGVAVVIEPVNARDRPDSLVARSREALAALDAADHRNLALQYDVYHMTMMGEDVIAALPALAGRVGHIQFADVPGRHEPGSGQIDFPAVFAAIDRCGYAGWVGAEYSPSRETTATLGWLRGSF